MNSGIYQIRNIVNNKVYVGQTKHFKQRANSHFRELRNGKHYNRHLQRSFGAYGGEVFVFEVLERCGATELNSRERYWIETKRSEYAKCGYNAAYAVTLFNKYSNEPINKSRRVPSGLGRSMKRSTLEKISLKNKAYWNNKTEEERLSFVLSKSSLSLSKIKEIKLKLAHELDKSTTEIADETNANRVIVTHISQGRCYLGVLPGLNILIKNRTIIKNKRIDKKAISKYRDGFSYALIALDLGINERNIIRRINSLKDQNDDRARINSQNYILKINYIKVARLKKQGYTDKQIAEKLGCSRSAVQRLKNKYREMIITDVTKTNGLPKRLVYAA